MSTLKNSTDEDFDVFVSTLTDEEEEDEDSCSNETEDEEITRCHGNESPISNANTTQHSITKFSIASILGTEKDREDGGGKFVRPTPVSAVIRPSVALYPGAFFAHQTTYPGSNSGLMLEMLSPTPTAPGSEHPPYYPASAASLLYGGWFTASAANKTPGQLFGLQ
ncbi:hypothetical protein L9F63_027617, partial [Diploptera punctata]